MKRYFIVIIKSIAQKRSHQLDQMKMKRKKKQTKKKQECIRGLSFAS
jgi:hypothetical protein